MRGCSSIIYHRRRDHSDIHTDHHSFFHCTFYYSPNWPNRSTIVGLVYVRLGTIVTGNFDQITSLMPSEEWSRSWWWQTTTTKEKIQTTFCWLEFMKILNYHYKRRSIYTKMTSVLWPQPNESIMILNQNVSNHNKSQSNHRPSYVNSTRQPKQPMIQIKKRLKL